MCSSQCNRRDNCHIKSINSLINAILLLVFTRWSYHSRSV